MSDFQQYPAVDIEGTTPNWDEVWENSPIPDQKELWRKLISAISRTPEIPERLTAHGWTANDFDRALTDPLYLINLHQDAVGPQAEAAFIVLSDAVGRIHESRKSLALELRQQTMIDLALPILDADKKVLRKGWSYGQIGALVGLTKQRAQQLGKPRGIARSLGISESRAMTRSGRIAYKHPGNTPQS